MVPIVKRAIFGLFLLASFGAAASARAGDNTSPSAPQTQAAPDQQNEGFVRSIAKQAGVATDVGPPQDFVLKSRPSAPKDYVPIFRKTEEHKTKVLSPDRLKAMEAELDATGSRDAKIRDAFPPARKAYLDEQREKAAKAANKRASSAATTAQ
jgi:hypothetical protein